MAPAPKQHPVEVETAPPLSDAPPSPDAIVISGMSGVLPGCHNVVEFAEKLYAKENLVKKYKPRSNFKHPELPEQFGRLPDLGQFDAQFFRVHYRIGHNLDAMARKILENTYQAIYDAGMSPAEFSAKRVAVYMAVGCTETEKAQTTVDVQFGILGCNRAMIANRVSYWLNVKGPSITVDASCSSSLVAFEKAYQTLASGECDAAIVGAGKVLLHPHSIINYHRLVPQNEDGKTKCFDINADGQSSSEAITVFLLQKYKDSKRVYASLCNAKARFGVLDDGNYTKKYGHRRDPELFAKFLREFYDEAGVPPSLVEYVEGFGAAVPETDKMELQVIEEVFCKDRSSPLSVGSVMSNIGYTEAASGSMAIMKVLLAYHSGEIAANLHCDSPRQDIAALRDGRMRIVTEHERCKYSYAAVNSLSLTGMNGHALLQGHYKPKDLFRYHSEIPYLLPVSGRQESAVQKILDHIKERPLDAEEIALLHNIHKYPINGHLARGFGIFSTNEQNQTTVHREAVDYFDDARRPLWFVYSGMGSQWAGMGAQLMRIPVFAAAVERCQKLLEPKGVDIIHILTSPDKTIFDNILYSFVGIAAVQIGLTDVLTSIGLVPDKIIGHSVGELGCAYADGCFSAEEIMLAAYSRGSVSLETPLIVGSMAAVGLGYEKISTMCPPEIEVACHNGPDSSTISGPADVMREFVAQLTSTGIFAKEVPCSNIAYHSRYIASAGPALLKYLREVIKNPKRRSERWVSTSVPQERWHEETAKYSSAEYHTNNLLSPVLFEETSRLIPSNAVLVEIAPHGLLQAILKRSLPASCTNIALTKRGHADNALLLLEAIGQMYMQGYDTNVAALYPQVEFPVSTGTAMLSHVTEWVYAEKWNLCQFVTADENYASIYNPVVSAYDDEYLTGHIIEGTRHFPYAAALIFVWDTLAMTLSQPRRSLSVQFRDIHFHAQPNLPYHKPLYLRVALMRGTGRFEVSYEHSLVVEGTIFSVVNYVKNFTVDQREDSLVVSSNDIYKLLHERGYDYKGDFRSIYKTNLSFDQAQLVWRNNWVTLIDGLIQLNVLRRPHAAISQPTHIGSLRIDPKKHFLQKTDSVYRDAIILEKQELTHCGGVSIKRIRFVDKPYSMRQDPALKSRQFFPFFLQEDCDQLTTIYVFMQIILEKLPHEQINIFDCICSKKPSIVESVKQLLGSAPEIRHEVISIRKHEIPMIKNKKPKPDVVILYDLLSDKQMLEILYDCLPPNTFIVSIGVETAGVYPAAVYRPVCGRGTGTNKIEMALWRPSLTTSASEPSVENSSEIDILESTCSDLLSRDRLSALAEQQKEVYDRNTDITMSDHKVANGQGLDQLPSLLDHGKPGGYYYLPLPTCAETDQTLALKSSQIGNLDSLDWVEAQVTNEGVPVMVHYAALNAYDAKRARAEIPIRNANEGYGMDFSGITERGERVFGVVQSGAMCSRVNALSELLWPVPDHWDLEDAATVPLPYLQAFYCLAIKTELRKGMRVLIHGGAGALGQAAISIALAKHCEVFTTVSDIRKKNFLLQLFPTLKAEYIGNSRDISFCDMVLNATKGAGCHIVINCLKGELKNASLSCCASYGTTLDAVQIITRENFSYGMYHMTKARSYIAMDLSAIFESNSREEMQKLRLLIAEGISQGYVRPLSRLTYPARDAARAFRLLAASNHRGRVLLRLHGAMAAMQAHPRLFCSPETLQLLICEEEVLSLQLVERLINRGAKTLRLYYPRPSAYLNVKKASWQKSGVKVDTVLGQIHQIEKLEKFLHDGKDNKVVESLLYVAKDCGQQTIANSIIQKIDLASRELFPSLKYFAVISEGSLWGRDTCRDRALRGLPALSLQLQHLDQFDEAGRATHDAVSKQGLTCQTAVDIIEQALCTGQPAVLGYAISETPRTLLEEVARIPGVKITSSTHERSTLEQVGVDQGRAQELCFLLEEKFKIGISQESLPQMTIAKLKQLEKKLGTGYQEESGISAYFNAIDADEIVASTELVLMPTLVLNSEPSEIEIDTTKTYLCLIPGVESHHRRFSTLCDRLKLPAVVLQSSIDDLDETVQEMAQSLVNVMRKRLKTTQNFYLLGYELGILVALEMAAILEGYGLTGTVFCLGGTPEDIRTSLEGDFGGVAEDTLQDSLLQCLTTLMMGDKSPNLDLQTAKTLQDKIETCVKQLRGKVSYTSQFTRSYLRAAYNRIKMIRKYKTKPCLLRSKIVILRAKLPRPLDLNVTEGCSEQPIAVHELNASLAQAPGNLQCSAIVNQYLEPAILEAFDNSNLCDTYLVTDALTMEFTAKDH